MENDNVLPFVVDIRDKESVENAVKKGVEK